MKNVMQDRERVYKALLSTFYLNIFGLIKNYNELIGNLSYIIIKRTGVTAICYYCRPAFIITYYYITLTEKHIKISAIFPF